MKSAESKQDKIRCPYCGYIMPIKRDKNAVCKGVYVKCKGAHCGVEFEIKINSEIK